MMETIQNHQARVWKFLCVILFFGVVLSCGIVGEQKKEPRILNGRLDLSGWSFEKDGPVSLDGPVEFWWHDLVSPDDFAAGRARPADGVFVLPAMWNGYVLPDGAKLGGDGYATFRLRIQRTDMTPLVARVLFAVSAYRLYVNGRLICQSGIVGRDRETARAVGYYPCNGPVEASGPELDVVLHVSNFDHARGGPRKSITLGDRSAMTFRMVVQRALDGILVGSVLVLALYHGFFYFLRRREPAYLYLSLLSAGVVLRMILIGENLLGRTLPGMSWDITMRSMVPGIFGCPILMYLFLRRMFPEETSKRTTIIYVVISAVFLSTFFLPLKITTLAVSAAVPFWIANCAHLLTVTVLAVVRKRPDARPLFVGIAVWCALFVNDVLHTFQIVNTEDYQPIGLFAFLCTQMIVMGSRYSRTVDTLQLLNEDLKVKNAECERFIYAVSHDLRSPLVTIQSFVGFIREAVKGGTHEKINDDLDSVQRSARKMESLLADLSERKDQVSRKV